MASLCRKRSATEPLAGERERVSKQRRTDDIKESDDPTLADAGPLPGLEDVPPEVLYMVVAMCEFPDMCRLACVSKALYAIASDVFLRHRAFERALPPCTLPHLCRARLTDVLPDPAFLTDGFAALGVPLDQKVRIDETTPEPPRWACAIGQRLLDRCVDIARSSTAAYPPSTPVSPCRHVPPSIVHAYGFPAAYRASVRPNAPPLSRPTSGLRVTGSRRLSARDLTKRPLTHLRALYEWPCAPDLDRSSDGDSDGPPRNTIALLTDARSFAKDVVALIARYSDADGNTLWVSAQAPLRPSKGDPDAQMWCCVGPVREPSGSTEPWSAPAVCSRSDVVVCGTTFSPVDFDSLVDGAAVRIQGNGIMVSRASGDVYRGAIQSAMRQGYGKAYFAGGGLAYEGIWFGDSPGQGGGSMYTRDGLLLFEGGFLGGLPGSRGTLHLGDADHRYRIYALSWGVGPGRFVQPVGDGHVQLPDGTRIVCTWTHYDLPPLVKRVRVSAARSGDGRVRHIDMCAPAISFYESAEAFMDGREPREPTERRSGVRASPITAPLGRKRIDARKRWAGRLLCSFVATRSGIEMGERSHRPDAWLTAAIAEPQLRFSLDLTEHGLGTLVVDLLDL